LLSFYDDNKANAGSNRDWTGEERIVEEQQNDDRTNARGAKAD
jgi:hypothetical protein